MVCWNLCHAYLLEVGLMQIHAHPWYIIHSLTCKNPCKLDIHASFFGPLRLHLPVWSELRRSRWPFRPIRSHSAMVTGLQSCVRSGLIRPDFSNPYLLNRTRSFTRAALQHASIFVRARLMMRHLGLHVGPGFPETVGVPLYWSLCFGTWTDVSLEAWFILR
jgi:hypothetical protein